MAREEKIREVTMPKWISEIWDAEKAKKRADAGAVIITDRFTDGPNSGKVLVLYPGDKWAEMEMKDKIGLLTVEGIKDLMEQEQELVNTLGKLNAELQILRSDSGRAADVEVIEGKVNRIRGKLDTIAEQKEFEKRRAIAEGIEIKEEPALVMELSDDEAKLKAEGEKPKRGRPPKTA